MPPAPTAPAAATQPPPTTTITATAWPPDTTSCLLSGPVAAAAAVDAVLAAYARAPPTGRPAPGAWTPLAGFAVVTSADDADGGFNAVCVAWATGSKCVGADRRDRAGAVVNDGHAEVLARRALVRWVVNRLKEVAEEEGNEVRGGDDGRLFFERVDGDGDNDDDASQPPLTRLRFRRAPGWSLHLVTTAPPCGDAAIVEGGGVTGARALSGGDHGSDATDAAAGTPAHKLPTSYLDVDAQAAAAPAALGAPRRKPGKGPPTLSLSCSDKLARWTGVGVQGALVARVLEGALYVGAVTVVGDGGGEGVGEGKGGSLFCPTRPSPQESSAPPPPALVSLSRALVDRMRASPVPLPPPFRLTPPVLHLARSPRLTAVRAAPPRAGAPPAPTSTSWARVRGAGGNWAPVDVVVGATGVKAGAVRGAGKRGRHDTATPPPPPPSLLPAVCKRAAYARWRALVRAAGGTPPPITYGAAKRGAVGYAAASAALRSAAAPLAGWIRKPAELEEFCLECGV